MCHLNKYWCASPNCSYYIVPSITQAQTQAGGRSSFSFLSSGTNKTYLQREIRNLQVPKAGLDQHEGLVWREGAALDPEPLGEADAFEQIVERSLLGLADRAADLGAAATGVEQVLQTSVERQRAQDLDRLEADHLWGGGGGIVKERERGESQRATAGSCRGEGGKEEAYNVPFCSSRAPPP